MSNNSISNEIEIIILLEEKDNKEIKAKLKSSTLISNLIDEISKLLLLSATEKEFRKILHKGKVLENSKTIEGNSILNGDIINFKKHLEISNIDNSITITVEMIHGTSYQFSVDSFSYLQEIAEVFAEEIKDPIIKKNIEYHFFSKISGKTGIPLDSYKSYNQLNIKNGSIILCKKVYQGGFYSY